MAIYHRSSNGHLLGSLGETLSLAFAASKAIVSTIANRRAARKVADLPDYLLSDIGLRRDDVHAALSRDWRSDPTYLMSAKAAENARRCRKI